MVTDSSKRTRKAPVPQASRELAFKPNKINANTPYNFAGKDLTPYGGLSREQAEMSKAARFWILILGAGLFAGVVGVIQNGWQHPADTIGASAWLALAFSTALAMRHQSRNCP